VRTIIRRYNPLQPRAANGRWGDGGLPGDVVNLTGLHDVVEIEGTFGALAMGVDEVGDVRLAFRDGGQVVEMDLDGEDVAGLGDAIEALAEARAELPDDADGHGVYDDRRFGFQDSHTVELLGNGVITVTFGADEDDPATLHLDPPDDGGEDSDATDDVADLLAAIDEVLQGVFMDRASVERKYNPGQLRVGSGEDGGQWTSTGATRDTLRLDGRINLRPGERLVGSGRVDSDQGGIRLAVTDTAGRRMIRFGAGGEGYGRRDRDAGIAAWDGNASPPPLPPGERERLKAEQRDLIDDHDEADGDDGRQAQTDARLADIQELLTGDDIGFNGTANLDEYSLRRVVDRIRPALEEAIEQYKTEQAAWDEIERLEAAGDFDPERMAELRRVARADDTEYITFTEGIVAGSEWGDVHFEVEMGDDEPYVLIGVTPKGAPDDWGKDQDWRGVFTPADMRKFFRLVDRAFQDAQRARSPENGDTAPAGGQFAVGGGRVGGQGKKPATRRPRRRAAPAGPLAFDGKTGTGYGIKGGDQRVRGLQSALTRLGVTDSDGKPLAADGKYGPKTTSAVKKLQKALGVEADGKVTPELLKRIGDLKQLPTQSPRPARKARAKTSARRAFLLDQIDRALRMGVAVRAPQLFDRAFPLADIQISRSGDGRTVEAYAAMFGTPYEVRDQHGHYMEVIDRAAFNRTLAGGAGQSAMCLYNHGMSVVDGKPDPMAQIPIGTPLEIKPDGQGLLTVTRYNKSPYADEVLEAIRNGAIRSQSFRGRIIRSSPDRVPTRSRSGGLPTITRHELGLTDYGPTPIPVNAGAAIMAIRSREDLLADFAALPDDDRLELLRSLGVELDGADTEIPQDEAPALGDDTPTSTVELGAEDPPLTRHSGRQIDITRRIRAAQISRGMR
jgi:HK97 family phage prohead protease